MKARALVLALLSMGLLSAQPSELGIFAGQQTYPSFSAANPGYSTLGGSAPSKPVLAIRFGRSLLGLGPGSLQATLGFQPRTTTTLTLENGALGNGSARFATSHAALGAMFNLKGPIDGGLGLEYRFERLSTPGASTAYRRPWVRATIGRAFPALPMNPSFGVELAFPLTSTKLGSAAADLNQVQKAMAPRSQVGLYASWHF